MWSGQLQDNKMDKTRSEMNVIKEKAGKNWLQEAQNRPKGWKKDTIFKIFFKTCCVLAFQYSPTKEK